MFRDFRQGDPVTEFDCDLCIVGSGPAGIAMAREFIGSNLHVILAEGGGIEPDGDTQALYAGESVGEPHTDLDACRLRFLGGSSNCWNGWCCPFDAADFEYRDWVPHSGWPIARKDLDDHYARAGVVCEVGPQGYEETYWDRLGLKREALDEDHLRFCNWRVGPPTRFGERYHDELAAARDVTVLLNANAVELRTATGTDRIEGLEIASLTGRSATIRARHYVLACGGIENARLLLASDRDRPAGLGNGHDQVGRYFMEHPYATSALAFSKHADFLPQVEKQVDGVELQTGFCTTRTLQARERTLASMLLIEHQKDIDPLFSWGRRPLPETPPGMQRYIFLSQSEQAPNPESRILLSDIRDALGSRRARMDWRLTELDKRSITVQVKALGAEFARLGLGRVKLADWLLDGDAFWGVRAGNHHMGTTRMGDDPKLSVVDRHCRVHGLANLHIAGSSVFTTSSWANPTLTIVALALRLADRLKEAF